MAREQCLLDRISSRNDRGQGRYQPTTKEDLESLMESVRRHLNRLLNSRHGMSESAPEYGLPSLVDITSSSGNHVQRISDAIRSTIEEYEPRLRRVKVSAKESEQVNRQTLVFRVDAVLVGRSGEHRVWYETAIRGNGEFDVNG